MRFGHLRPSIALLLLGCAEDPKSTEWKDSVGDSGWSEPTQTQTRLGSFNIDWLADHFTTVETERDDFAPRVERDYEMIRDLIEASEFDLVVLQEIEGDQAIELLGLTSNYAWVTGTTGWSQNIAFLYRSDKWEMVDHRELRLAAFDGAEKAPFVGEFRHRASDLRLTLVGVHLKAYTDNAASRERQEQARSLGEWLEADLPDEASESAFAENVVVAGDFNDTFEGLNPSWPAVSGLEGTANLRFASRQTTGFSYIDFESLIDHIALTPGLYQMWPAGEEPEGYGIITHDLQSPWNDYSGGYRDVPNISSHRPVYVDLRLGQ